MPATQQSNSSSERRTRQTRRKSDLEAKFKVAYLLSLKKTESTLILAVCATVLSLGFLFGEGNNVNYTLIYDFAHRYFWMGLFAVYAYIKFLTVWTLVDYKIVLINCIVGLWAWLYLFLSFTIYDTTAIAPTEYLLAVPIMAEAWLMLSLQHNK